MRPLGCNQIAALLRLANPTIVQVVPDRLTRGLVARGLAESLDEDGEHFFRITGAGLRALAELRDAGALDGPQSSNLTPTLFVTFADAMKRPAFKIEGR